MAPGSTIPAEHAMRLVSLWTFHNRDTDRLMRRSGIARDLLASRRGRLTQAQFTSFFSSAALILRDESLGLCPQQIPIGTFALTCRAAVSYPTLGTALRVGLANYRIISKAFAARCNVDRASCAHVSLTDNIANPEARRQFHSTFIFFLYSLMCWITERRLPLRSVDFSFPSSSAGAELERAYQVPVRYNASRTVLSFDSRLLRLTNMQDLRSCETLLRNCPGALAVAYDDEADITQRVRKHLRANVAGRISLNQMATQLNVSVATLRRRLDDAGTSFQKVKDGARRDLSINLLVETDLRLEDLAERVGFVEVSAFHRAFRRWTGCAPSDYRRRITAP